MPPHRPSSPLPIPPNDLLQRIGPMGEEDPGAVFESTGRVHRAMIEDFLPEDWDWTGRRTLDFGCGSGRVIRQFLPEAERAEFWGCDIDRPSIDWLQANLEPPFHFFATEEEAKLPQEDGFFDLIYAFSVYTHFTDNWAGWMAEHHRVLADGGLMLLSFLGEGMLNSLTGDTWDGDRVGMNPVLYGYPWELGGPIAFNSEWWIRAHWGRAFEVVTLNPIQGGDPPFGHGMALLRKKSGTITVEELERLEPDEPREIAALQYNVEQLRDDTLRLREDNARVRAVMDDQREQITAAHATIAENVRLRQEMERSISWRLTAPLRAARTGIRRLRPPVGNR
ncbi:MAG: methyltransferase domain-containing protein [Actinobacteria bacterium]|nr:methyltransferase domain-containing protein [Actinomycetota bacterium]